jgi:hypothetical protein
MQAGWVAGLHPASTGAACTDAGICGGPRVAAYFLRALRLPACPRARRPGPTAWASLVVGLGAGRPSPCWFAVPAASVASAYVGAATNPYLHPMARAYERPAPASAARRAWASADSGSHACGVSCGNDGRCGRARCGCSASGPRACSQFASSTCASSTRGKAPL